MRFARVGLRDKNAIKTQETCSPQWGLSVLLCIHLGGKNVMSSVADTDKCKARTLTTVGLVHVVDAVLDSVTPPSIRQAAQFVAQELVRLAACVCVAVTGEGGCC